MSLYLAYVIFISYIENVGLLHYNQVNLVGDQLGHERGLLACLRGAGAGPLWLQWVNGYLGEDVKLYYDNLAVFVCLPLLDAELVSPLLHCSRLSFLLPSRWEM